MNRTIHRRRGRRGGALLLVVACLSLMALVFLALTRVAAAARLDVRAEEKRLLAAWLAESGLERAYARLVAASDYKGETWNLSRDDLGGGKDDASIVITVEPSTDADTRRVTVRAETPRGDGHARKTRIATVKLPKRPPGDGQ